MKGPMLNQACRSMQKSKDNKCVNLKNRDFAHTEMPWDPIEIEDLHKFAKYNCICPYYAMKDRAAGADLILMPYNYLIDEKLRSSFDIDYENSVIIFDEAHNIIKNCEDNASFTISSKKLE